MRTGLGPLAPGWQTRNEDRTLRLLALASHLKNNSQGPRWRRMLKLSLRVGTLSHVVAWQLAWLSFGSTTLCAGVDVPKAVGNSLERRLLRRHLWILQLLRRAFASQMLVQAHAVFEGSESIRRRCAVTS